MNQTPNPQHLAMLHPEKYLHVLQPEHATGGCGDSCESSEPHCIRQISVDQVREAVSTLTAGQTSLMEARAPQANSPR
jgi:hypothetical protein